MFSFSSSRVLTLALLAIIPVTFVFAAEHQVVVGGPGILRYNPEYVVSIVHLNYVLKPV